MTHEPSESGPERDEYDVVDDLLAYPPLNLADVQARTRGCSSNRLVTAIEEAVEEAVDENERVEALALLGRIAPGHPLIPLPPMPGDLHDEMHRPLPTSARDFLASEFVEEILAAVRLLPEIPSLAEAMADKIVRVPPPLQIELLPRLERARERAGVPARLLHEPLAKRELAPAVRAAVDRILAAHATVPRTAEGFAWIGGCDGTGAASLVAGFHHPDTTYTVVDVIWSVDGGVQEAVVLAQQSKKAAERMLDGLRKDGIDFVRAPLGLAARLVADAVERGRAAGAVVSKEVAHALSFFDSARPVPPLPAPAPLVTTMPPEPVAELLRRDEYTSWFFDVGELVDHGVKLPPGGAGESANRNDEANDWTETAVVKLDQPPLRRRIAAMARHMALYHELRREPREAALLHALAWPPGISLVGDAVAEHGETTPCAGAPANELFWGLVSRSFFLVDEQLEPVDVSAVLGDPELRHHLKRNHFASVEEPRGGDLARLDLTELVVGLLAETLHLIPPAHRPPPEQQSAVALQVADETVLHFRSFVAPGRRFTDGFDLLPSVMRAALVRGSKLLTREDATALADQMAPAVQRFLAEVCMEKCPIACWKQLDRSAALPFFSSDHPALGRPESDDDHDSDDADTGDADSGERGSE